MGNYKTTENTNKLVIGYFSSLQMKITNLFVEKLYIITVLRSEKYFSLFSAIDIFSKKAYFASKPFQY